MAAGNSEEKEIGDNELINEGYSKNPWPLWSWLFVIIGTMVFLWSIQSSYSGYITEKISESPFLQVTNREMSLFLWQNPIYMRVNSKTKSGYLTGFEYLEKVNIEEGFAEKIVAAPPELLFLYHTWARLLKSEVPPRKVTPQEFVEFLEYVDEWQPKNWPNAPKGYKDLVDNVFKSKNLFNDLPLDVKIAFIGWKNYFKEGEAINGANASYGLMQKFLKKYVNYQRANWRNISGEEYLKTLTFGKFQPDEIIPKEEVPPFLRVAFFNAIMAEKE